MTPLPQTIQKEKFFDPRKPFQSQRPETHEEWQARMGGEVLAVVRSGLFSLVLAQVFDRAVSYKQDNDLTI